MSKRQFIQALGASGVLAFIVVGIGLSHFRRCVIEVDGLIEADGLVKPPARGAYD